MATVRRRIAGNEQVGYQTIVRPSQSAITVHTVHDFDGFSPSGFLLHGRMARRAYPFGSLRAVRGLEEATSMNAAMKIGFATLLAAVLFFHPIGSCAASRGPLVPRKAASGSGRLFAAKLHMLGYSQCPNDGCASGQRGASAIGGGQRGCQQMSSSGYRRPSGLLGSCRNPPPVPYLSSVPHLVASHT